jgi:hypothetical protein
MNSNIRSSSSSSFRQPQQQQKKKKKKEGIIFHSYNKSMRMKSSSSSLKLKAFKYSNGIIYFQTKKGRKKI